MSIKSAESEAFKKVLLTVIKYVSTASLFPFLANLLPFEEIQQFLGLIEANIETVDAAIFAILNFGLAVFASLRGIFQKEKMEVAAEPASLLKSGVDTRL